ncbi:MAG: diguanylate cyclase (GGDEF)-like protein/PAS domain S-box-containing protein [Candidatus Azotimanducaceae bacterium]
MIEHRLQKHRLVFPVLSLLVILCVGAGVFSVYSVLEEAGKYLSARTQSWIVDLTRTENFNTIYQKTASAYFDNPTMAGKEELKLLNERLRSRRDLIAPELLKSQFPAVLKKTMKEEFGYYDEALSSLSILLNTPGLLKAEQQEIERHLRSLDVSMTYINTELVIAVQNEATARQSSLRNLSFTIIILSLFLAASILALAKFMLKLRRQSSILKSSENRLRLALVATKQAWFDLNIQTGEPLTSPEYAKLLGYDPAKFHGDLQGWQNSLHPDDHHAVIAAYQKSLDQGSEFSVEYRRRKKAGGWLWFNTTAEITEWSSSQRPLRMIGIHTDITQRKQAEEKLERNAHYDLLTNLPNRVLLADRLSHAMVQCQRRNRSLAVTYLDLDGFKIINDTHGHGVGDELLIAVSQRMREALREGDTLARIGGDEFVAIIVDLEKTEDSKPVIERMLKAASESVTLGDAALQVSASIGVTVYPQDGVDADQLMRHADQAMYVAKQAGKNRYHLFDTALDNAINIQQESIADIRLALGKDEFVLHYQPKVNMRTGAVIGVEALIRWQHPDRGLVSPLEFLPTIEGRAISLELGEWVLQTALTQISQWRSLGVNLPVSVNISAYQLQQRNFSTRLSALLATHPELSPQCLELEILETSALNDISQASTTMKACKEIGVRFALDDFGTGYSSLTHLRRLPAYLIKIDQSFVRDMLEDADDLAIVQSVVGLAKAFELEVIAEGVETIAHGVALLKLGCELAQGYGIARPMPADDIPEWIFSWKVDDSWQERSLVEASRCD